MAEASPRGHIHQSREAPPLRDPRPRLHRMGKSSRPQKTKAPRGENGQAKLAARLPRVPRQEDQARRMKYRCGNLQCFHGAFSTRAKAQAKAKKIKGARIKGAHVRRGDYRYLVLTPKK